jgi:sulfonate transport system substrate-binding protein
MTIENDAPCMKRLLLRSAAVLAALSAAGSFFACSRTEQKGSGPPEKITVACSATLDSTLAQVAQVRGYFLQEGLAATPQKHPLGKFALQSLLEGKADIATVAETPVMFAILKGEKISVIATIQSSKRNYVVIARRDKGILSPRDFKGKKIAAALGTSGDYFLDVFLGEHGISRNEVTVANLKPEEMLDAVVNGDVDAIASLPFIGFQAQEKLGDRAIAFDPENIYTQFFNVVARQEFVHRYPGRVKKVLLALIRAEEFVKDDPAGAQRVVADFSRIDMATVRKGWEVNSFTVSLDQSLLLALEDESRWAIKSGNIGKTTMIPNYLDFICFDGLNSVSPELVRILK